MMIWFEDLPDQCPPADAVSPNGGVYYRLVSSDNVSSEDFISVQMEMPWQQFLRADPCILRAVSIFSEKADCEKITKFPRHKNKKVYALILDNSAGLVKPTSAPSHHSWWRSSDFQIESENE